MKYKPTLSVDENAKLNNCSVSSVRKYIRLNHIDRRYEAKANVINAIRSLIKKEPNVSKQSISDKLGVSLNTIKKYLPYAMGEKELSKIDTNKVSKTDIREIKDYYATHPSVIQDLLRVENFNQKILEPCCGGGYMAEVLNKAGYDVYASDIVNRGYGQQADFLTDEFEPNVCDIITNPPYNDIIPFIGRALELCKEKVAILMPLRYLSGRERYAFFQKHPPIRVYCYINRINIAKNGRFDVYNDAGANMEIYAWYIWEKSYIGKTELKWIINKRHNII